MKTTHEKSKQTQPEKIDERLEAVVERMFERCFTEGQFKQAIGIALETRRLDVVEKAILKGRNLIQL